MKYALIVLIFVSYSAHAVFQKIWKGYKTSSIEQLRQVETAAVNNALDVSLSQNAWALELEGLYDDSFLDALFAFNAQRTITEQAAIKLTKPTFNFGTLSYEIRQAKYDISFWTATGFASSDADLLYETRNTITYSYDLIGRTQPLKEEFAQAQFGADKAQNDLDREQEYLDFYKAYMAAKLQVYRTRLAEEFRDRAARLRAAIYKRYKDGLSREAEYLQAKNSELSQEIEVEKAKASLKESVAVIETILGFPIPQKYFDELQWDFKKFADWKSEVPESKSKRMLALDARIKLVEKDLERFEDSRGHKLTLSASYVTNSFNEDLETSYYQGDIITPSNDSKSVALNYSIPLGMDYDKAEKERLFIDKKRSEIQKLRLKDELELTHKVLITKIQRYESAYRIGSKQVDVASRRVDQQAKLYLRGLGTFDETIRAEQELLNAKSALYQTLYEYDISLGDYSFLNGNVEKLLNYYRD